MMSNKINSEKMGPELWGLSVNSNGQLLTGGCNTIELAKIYNTPLHVVNSERLAETVHNFKYAVKKFYPGKSSVHFAFKCNPVAGVLQIIRHAGMKAEIMSDFELYLADNIGYSGHEIIVNGPYKTANFLRNCIRKSVRLIIVDSLWELNLLNAICEEEGTIVDILLRVNPDYVPKGMNQGSSTASRKGSPLGIDLYGGELDKALEILNLNKRLHFQGLHFHIGSGIHDPDDYRRALIRLESYIWKIKKSGFNLQVFDVGGGFGTSFSREMTTTEMIKYQALGRLPKWRIKRNNLSPETFIKAITDGLEYLFFRDEMPELILEPGRCISSSNQILLLTIHQVKERNNGKIWLITNGGIGTVTMPTFYEFHKIFLCNDVFRKVGRRVTISGPGCFAADLVYRNIRMPEAKNGEVIAIMDSGAYFTSWESSFGYPLPSVVKAADGNHQLIRARETFSEKLARDKGYIQNTYKTFQLSF